METISFITLTFIMASIIVINVQDGLHFNFKVNYVKRGPDTNTW